MFLIRLSYIFREASPVFGCLATAGPLMNR